MRGCIFTVGPSEAAEMLLMKRFDGRRISASERLWVGRLQIFRDSFFLFVLTATQSDSTLNKYLFLFTTTPGCILVSNNQQ